MPTLYTCYTNVLCLLGKVVRSVKYCSKHNTQSFGVINNGFTRIINNKLFEGFVLRSNIEWCHIIVIPYSKHVGSLQGLK